jgi:hypothetical protein
MIVQAPAEHPPVHTPGHTPPGGVGALLQPLDDEDDDVLEALDVLDVLEAADVLVMLDAPPEPASLASGSSCTPRMSAQAGAARPASTAAERTTFPEAIRTTPR